MWLGHCLMALLLVAALVGCGIVEYPGQPDQVTNGYAKIDLEDLQLDGLYVYEVVYDNRAGAKGVGAIVTKFYEGARTFTSNSRFNADGTLFRHKEAYQAAATQMISIPSLKQIHMSPDSHVTMLVSYENSLDEVDDKNIAENGLFAPLRGALAGASLQRLKQFQRFVSAATIAPSGMLAAQVYGAELAGKTFRPSKPVSVQASFTRTALQSSLDSQVRAELQKFVESEFPKGYRGPVKFLHSDGSVVFEVPLTVQTLKTAKQAGYQIVQTRSQSALETLAETWGQL